MKRKFNDFRFKFFIGNLEGLEWYVLNFESKKSFEMEFIVNNMIDDSDIIVEVGSHHGLTTIILANYAYKGKVIAIEPFRENVNILKRNIEINKLENVEIVDKAISSKRERILISGSDGVNNSSKKEKQEIEAWILDDFYNYNPDFIKIDVEGYEYEVLKGARKILKNIPKVALELHTEVLDKFNTNVKQILDCFPDDKYDIYIQWEDWQKPEKYDFKKEIKKRVHLFFIPKKD